MRPGDAVVAAAAKTPCKTVDAIGMAAGVAAPIKRGMEEFPGGISEDELDLTRAEQPLAGVARNEIGHDGRAEWTANCSA